MKKFKRRFSLTLRGSQTIDESLSELAEQMTIEENSNKDNGKYMHHIYYFSKVFRKMNMLLLIIITLTR